MRLKLDENLPWELAELFTEGGHDAVTVLTQELSGAADDVVASICLSEGRAIVSMDTDFADIRAYPPRDYSGIVVFRLQDQSRDNLLTVAARLLQTFSQHTLSGKLWIVEDTRVRIRD